MIDLVIPYVSMSDETWASSYKEIVGGDPLSNKYQDNPYLKYMFRGVEKYLPFIHNIYFVVCSVSQIPYWLNQAKVKVVLHKDFIPTEYLPTFNACTIELFMYKIPGLSNTFLYSNDDMYPSNLMSEEDFFKINIPQLHWMTDLVDNSSSYSSFISRQWHEFVDPNVVEIHYPQHVITPHRVDYWQQLWNNKADELKASITKTTDKSNYNQYAALDYMYGLDNKNVVENNFCGALYNNSDADIFMAGYELLHSKTRKNICINDKFNISLSEERKNKLISIFEEKFPDKSEYEK